MKYFLFTFYLYCFLCLPCKGQYSGKSEDNNNQVLWKITSPDIHHVSYLFGTMHSRDKRTFRFSDSVIVKLEECSLFAMEVIPDSILKEIFKPGSHIKNQYSSTFNYHHKSIDNNREQHNEYLDTYLYRIAKEKGKATVNLENPIDQKNLFAKLSFQPQINQVGNTDVLSSYTNGNLTDLDLSITENTSPHLFEEIFSKRNNAMTVKIDSLIKEGSTFIAVGAGHLGGKYGILNLLKNKGYTITPIEPSSNFKNNHKVEHSFASWYTFKSTEGYSLKLPSEPFPYPIKNHQGEEIFTMHVYPDLSTGTIYYCYSIQSSNFNQQSHKEEFINQLISTISSRKNIKVSDIQMIRTNGLTGRDITMMDEEDKVLIRARVFTNGFKTFILMAGGVKDRIESEQVNHFFNSFKIISPKQLNWYDTNEQDGGFKISTPTAFHKENNLSTSKDYSNENFTYYSASDPVKPITYMVIYNDPESGIEIEDDSLYFENGINALAANIEGQIQSRYDHTVQGYPAKDFIICNNNNCLRGRSILRGSRGYLLLTTTTKEFLYCEEQDYFFNSFQLTAPLLPQTQLYKDKQKEFEIQLPSNPTIKNRHSIKLNRTKSIQYYSKDKYSGYTYHVSYSEFSPYYYNSDTNQFFKQIVDQHLNKGDSIVVSKSFSISGLSEREFVITSNRSHSLKRLKLIVRGNQLFELYALLPEQHLYSDVAQTFFTSFKSNSEFKSDVFTPKGKLLLEDLNNTHNEIAGRAASELINYSFRKEEIPFIYSALIKPYPDDTCGTNSTRLKLLNSLCTLADSSAIHFIPGLYPFLDAYPHLQIAALKVLANVSTSESLGLVFSLIHSSNLPEEHDLSSVFYPIINNTDLFIEYSPDLLTLSELKGGRNISFLILADLCNKQKVKTETLNALENTIISLSKILLKNSSSLNSTYRQEPELYQNIIDILVAINSNTSNKTLEEFTKVKDISVSQTAIVAMIKTTGKIDYKALKQHCKHPLARRTLQEELIRLNKTRVIPAKYWKNKFRAESEFAYLTSRGNEVPEKLKLVSKNNLKCASGEIYLFKYVFSKDQPVMVIGSIALGSDTFKSVLSPYTIPVVAKHKDKTKKELIKEICNR